MGKSLLISRSFHYVYILQNYLKIVNKFANFLVNFLKKEERQMGIGSMIVTVKVTNIDKFVELSKEFNKKARELEELAHELQTFHFEGDVASVDSN